MAQIIELTGFEYSYDLEIWKPLPCGKVLRKTGIQYAYMRHRKQQSIDMEMFNGTVLDLPAGGIIEFDYENRIINFLTKVNNAKAKN